MNPESKLKSEAELLRDCETFIKRFLSNVTGADSYLVNEANAILNDLAARKVEAKFSFDNMRKLAESARVPHEDRASFIENSLPMGDR